MNDELPLISVDDHVVEPPRIWTDRLPAKYQDVGPRIERSYSDPDALREAINGGKYDYSNALTDDPNDPEVDYWVYEDVIVPHLRLGASAGFSREEMLPLPITYDEMRPGCYQAAPRLEDMTAAGIEASVCFPNMFVRFCGQRFLHGKDKDLALLCVKAYNDFIHEEWCGESGGRLIRCGIVPLWDAELAAQEARRLADMGFKTIAFTEGPAKLGLPTLYTDYWDPFLQVCNDNSIVLSIHIGSSSQMPTTSDDAPAGVGNTLTFVNSAGSVLDWIFSTKLLKFPNLKLSFAEAQAGWVPYVLERADVVWDYNRAWNNVGDDLPVPPSELFRKHMYCCVFDDAHAMRNLDIIGEDNVTFETDYPHADSTWPDCREVAHRLTKELDDTARRKVLRENAIEMLGLELSSGPSSGR